MESYLAAAVEEYADAAAKGKRLYATLHGSDEGFDAALAAKVKALPFAPGPFKAPAGWKGKAVLAELFTGSECPPCVGADLAFDALIETFPAKYLAVLVYHLPIPRPDPMMNPATALRAGAYGVGSTPTVIIDGTNKSLGGGGRGAAEGKFAQYRAAIEPLLAEAPGVSLIARASLAGDTVTVAYDLDKAVPGAEYILVLVQDEQEHRGSNGVAVPQDGRPRPRHGRPGRAEDRRRSTWPPRKRRPTPFSRNSKRPIRGCPDSSGRSGATRSRAKA